MRTKIFKTMANRGDSQLGRCGSRDPTHSAHALLGAATSLVAQFRCGLWGWLASAKGKDEQIGRASGCPCPSVLVS